MKLFKIAALVLVLFFFTGKNYAYADVLHKGAYSNSCATYENEYKCNIAVDDSASCFYQYRNNTRCRQSSYHSGVGGKIYGFCCSSLPYGHILIPTILTVIIELSVFLLLKFRNKRAILSVIFVNLITPTILGAAFFFHKSGNSNDRAQIVGIEFLIAAVEVVVLLKLLSKEYSKSSIKFTVLLSNLISFFVGYLIS